MDEFTRECLAIDVAKRLTKADVLEWLSDLFVQQRIGIHSFKPFARRDERSIS